MSAHHGYLSNEFGSGEWRAECSCGWHGTLEFSERAAGATLEAHYATLPKESS